MFKTILKKAFVISGLLLAASNLYAGDDPSPAPQTREQKAGYAFGYRLGGGIRTDKVEVEFERTMQGFKDGINGVPPVLDEDEMTALVRQLSFERRQERAGEKPENQEQSEEVLKEKARKAGYTLGYRFGASVRTDELEVDLESARQGLQDAMDDKQPAHDPQEMANLMKELMENKRERMLRKVRETSLKNQKESENFLEENAKKEGIHTTESGLQYRILKEGDGARPKMEDMVTVHYKGTFIDGTEFDNSYAKGAPQTFETDGVIKGWTEVLQMMTVGSKWQVFVPPDLAYGRRGLGEKIPPNKVLVFEMELVAIEKPEE